MDDIKSIRYIDSDTDIKSIPKKIVIQKQVPTIYYNSLSTEKIIENGEIKHDTRVETDYDGNKGHFEVDINGKHFEKDFDEKDLKMFMKNKMKPYSSIDELKKNYGIKNGMTKANAKSKTKAKTTAKASKAKTKTKTKKAKTKKAKTKNTKKL
jgi:hypothetical protein